MRWNAVEAVPCIVSSFVEPVAQCAAERFVFAFVTNEHLRHEALIPCTSLDCTV